MDDDIFVDFSELLVVVNKNKPKTSKWMMGMQLTILKNKISCK